MLNIVNVTERYRVLLVIVSNGWNAIQFNISCLQRFGKAVAKWQRNLVH
ncbi:MAG: hypothetical protein GXP08_07295 [Gammaproteobacteria bacterium]|nr:hypothetical protein [Gammaproteobacteria bacterium]